MRLKQEGETVGRIVVYRRYFEKLLACPKPLRDQLIIELAALQGFRTGEISSFRAEYANFEEGLIQVLDSKKHKPFTLPLDPTLAQHLMAFMRERGISKGLLFARAPGSVGRPSKFDSKARGVAMSETNINRIWSNWCYASGVPEMSARYGRAYFACVWIFVHHKSMKGLQVILRHDKIDSTEFYLNKLVSFEDIIIEFFRDLELPFVAECMRFENCPVSMPGCKCKFFAPNVKLNSAQPLREVQENRVIAT